MYRPDCNIPSLISDRCFYLVFQNFCNTLFVLSLLQTFRSHSSDMNTINELRCSSLRTAAAFFLTFSMNEIRLRVFSTTWFIRNVSWMLSTAIWFLHSSLVFHCTVFSQTAYWLYWLQCFQIYARLREISLSTCKINYYK